MKAGVVHLIWERDGVVKEKSFPIATSFVHEDLTLIPQMQELQNGQLYILQMEVKTPLCIKRLSIHLTPTMTKVDQMMVNGYQSWTQSREMSSHEQISSLRWIAKQRAGFYGDYHFHKTSGKTGQFHSWTYTYLRQSGGQLFLVGSIDESFAFTILDYQFQKNYLTIEKELNDLTVQGQYTPFQLYMGTGKGLAVWDEYSSFFSQKKQRKQRISGWSSWYHYSTRIDQETVLNNLMALKEAQIPLDLFQIDNGYQQAIGDWLKPNEKFPGGMQQLAEQIRAQGYKPGLWLAPFICEEKSELYQKHPEWVLRDEKGSPVKAGWDADLGGWFYGLDFYASGFQDYVQQVFRTILSEWGYQMLKLDLLYAVALQPRSNKSRGQIMSEALTFLRAISNDQWLLGCGTPLGPAFGQVDYCQIGSDIALHWEDSKSAFLNNRERASAINSVLSAIGRWQLNQRVFMNEPAVFSFQDQANKLTDNERFTLFILSNLFGGLICFSDDIRDYHSVQLTQLRSMYPLVNVDLREVIKANECYRIKALIKEREYVVYANLSDYPCKLELTRSYFNDRLGFISEGTDLELKPHETVCLHSFQIPVKEPYLLGAKGHLFPGTQIEFLKISGEEINISLEEEASDETKVYIGVPYHFTNLKINGKYYSVKLAKTGLRYVSVSKQNLIK